MGSAAGGPGGGKGSAEARPPGLGRFGFRGGETSCGSGRPGDRVPPPDGLGGQDSTVDCVPLQVLAGTAASARAMGTEHAEIASATVIE